MKKTVFAIAVFLFGICGILFAQTSDLEDDFDDEFLADVETDYEIDDGIEIDFGSTHTKNKNSNTAKAAEKYEILDGIEDDEDDEFDDIDFSNLVYTPQTSGWTFGGYFSALQCKPTLSYIHESFEIEFACNLFFWDIAPDYFGIGAGPGLSIGYISNPFDGGIQNCVGISYDWYPVRNTHIGSLYYRFGIRSVWGSGFITEVKFPLIALLEGSRFTSIADVKMIPTGLLYSLVTLSAGYKFYF